MGAAGNGSPLFDPQQKLVTSYVFSAKSLAHVRLIFALYAIVSFIFAWIWDANHVEHVTNKPQAYLSYFTHLSYSGLGAYFLFSGIHSFAFARHPSRVYPLQEWPRPFQYLHLLLRTTILTFPILVTVVYWTLIASPATFATPYTTWANISHHILNSVFSLFETFLTNGPPPSWTQLPVTIVLLGGYLMIAYITRATQGFYPYRFLDPKIESPGKLAAYIIGIALAQCLIFVVIYVVTLFRIWLVRELSARGHRGGTGKVLEDDDGVLYYPLQPSRSIDKVLV